MRSIRRELVAALLATAVLSGCAATTYDASLATTSVVATTTTVPTGSTDDLLRRLADSLTGLSDFIGPDPSGAIRSGKTERLALIVALWHAVETDLTATDAHAADAIGRMVALAQTAVDRNRPADADKAARFAGQVIEDYLTR